MAPPASYKGVFAESDSLDESLHNIGKTERAYDRLQQLEDELKYGPQPEAPDTKYKLSQGWLKHADEVYVLTRDPMLRGLSIVYAAGS